MLPAEWVGNAPTLTSHLNLTGEVYRENRTAQLGVLSQLNEQLDLARSGGGDRYRERHHQRGRLLVRERIELLLDRDAPFLELSSLAAWGTDFTVGASIVTGIGVVSGVECVLIGHDPTVRGGAMNPYTLRKNAACTRDRPDQQAACDQPGGVRRRRSAEPVRAVYLRRQDLPKPHSALGHGYPDDRSGLWQLDGRRRLRPRHVRLRRSRRRPGQGIPGRAAAGADGDRRESRRRTARRCRHALESIGTI